MQQAKICVQGVVRTKIEVCKVGKDPMRAAEAADSHKVPPFI